MLTIYFGAQWVLFIKYILVFYESDNLALAEKQYNFREVFLVKYILLTRT